MCSISCIEKKNKSIQRYSKKCLFDLFIFRDFWSKIKLAKFCSIWLCDMGDIHVTLFYSVGDFTDIFTYFIDNPSKFMNAGVSSCVVYFIRIRIFTSIRKRRCFVVWIIYGKMKFINATLQVIFLLNVCLATLSPPSDKKGQKGVKAQDGPRKNNVLDRKLVIETPLVKDIIKYHATYHQDIAKTNFKNPVLGYVTPVSIYDYFLVNLINL